MKERKYRFELRYLYNGSVLEKCTRFFDGALQYPEKLIHKTEFDDNLNSFIPNKKENTIENSIEIENAFVKIENLCKMVLKSDSKNYLYAFYTHSNLGIAKEGVYEISNDKNNSVVIELIDHENPIYNAWGEITEFVQSRTLFQRSFDASFYIPIKDFIPNFWMVFYDWHQDSFIDNKRIEGDKLGIVSYLNDVVFAKKYQNRYTMDKKQYLKQFKYQ